MEAKSYTEITIIMTDDEAAWLKGLMQNPITSNETDKDKGMRSMFWEVLDREGIII